jgi:hypothetical protein
MFKKSVFWAGAKKGPSVGIFFGVILLAKQNLRKRAI